jgi:hypothetical protein
MTVLALLLGLAVFVFSLKLMRAAEVGSDAFRVARATVETMSTVDLSDREKELVVRRAAARMLWTFLSIALITGIGLVGAAALVWAGSAAGFYTFDEVAELATSIPFLLGSTAVAVVLWIALERLR